LFLCFHITISDTCDLELKDDFKITGDVYYLTEKDFNGVYSTWTESSMLDYVKEHNLKPVHYDNEGYSTHQSELNILHAEYVSINIDTE